MTFIRRKLRSLRRTVRDAFEDFFWRPVFFITVMPPLLLYCRLDETKALYRAKKHMQGIKKLFRNGKKLEEIFGDVWRRQRLKTRFDTTPNAAWEDGVEPETPEGNIPVTFYEAVNLLDDLIDDEEDRKLFQETSVAEVEAKYHHTLGRYLRNEWRLWTDGMPLRNWFVSMGMEHADDMSSLIISAWWHQLNDVWFDLDGRIELAKAYWRAMKPVLEAKPGEVFHMEMPYPLKVLGVNLRGEDDDGKN